MKTVACILACQLAIPVSPAAAANSREDRGSPQWIEGTLVGVDQAQRSVSYRIEPGQVTTATVGSEAALRKLTGLETGQKVKLKCHTTADSKVIVEDAKKASGSKWWLWTIAGVATAGLVWLWLLYHASE